MKEDRLEKKWLEKRQQFRQYTIFAKKPNNIH